MYILVNTLNNECIDWRPKTDEPFVVGENQLQVFDNFRFNPSIAEAVWKYLGNHKFEFRYYRDGRDLKINQLHYYDFINLITSKNLTNIMQYKAMPDGYRLWFIEDSRETFCIINNVDHLQEISEFETNYKSGCNIALEHKNEDGISIYSPTLEDVMGLYPKKKMLRGIATAGQINFFDTEVVTEKHINGGEYWINEESVDNVHEDDIIEFSIVDKNDILGMFVLFCADCNTMRDVSQVSEVCPNCGSNNRYTVGNNIIELVKFVETDYVKKGNKLDGYHSQLFEGIKGTNKVYTGLFFRVAYDSSGINDIGLKWRIYYYE